MGSNVLSRWIDSSASARLVWYRVDYNHCSLEENGLRYIHHRHSSKTQSFARGRNRQRITSWPSLGLEPGNRDWVATCLGDRGIRRRNIKGGMHTHVVKIRNELVALSKYGARQTV